MANKNFSLTRRACYLAGIIQAVVNNLTSLLFVIFNARPYDISLEKLGRLIFINFFAQLVIDFLSIYIVPKFGYRKCVVCAQFCSAVGLAMLGILPNILPPYIGLVISILLIAVGSGLIEVLSLDPRPGYKHDDPNKVYGFEFAGKEVKFVVDNGELTVVDIL